MLVFLFKNTESQFLFIFHFVSHFLSFLTFRLPFFPKLESKSSYNNKYKRTKQEEGEKK
jgi:hypothetical protein